MKKTSIYVLALFAFMALNFSMYSQGNHYFSRNTLTDPYGKFQLFFPGEPQYSYQDLETAVGSIRMYQFIYEDVAGDAYMLSYVDYPASVIAAADKNELLKSAAGGFIGHLGLTLQSEVKINYGDHHGLMFYADNGEIYSVMRDFLVGNRLFQIGILKYGAISVEMENNFFDSFVITK
jgi:hypothetical protein